MIKILNQKDRKEWNNLVSHLDVYYTCDYNEIYTEQGEPQLFYYQRDNNVIYYPFLLRSIEGTNFYDISSAYGYSGPLYIGDEKESANIIHEFIGEFEEYTRDNNIVSEFIRFHPLYQNSKDFVEKLNVNYVRDIVIIDTSSYEKLWDNLHQKKRNMIRKAMKFGVEVVEVPPLKYIDTFYDIYISTMKKQNANENYYFSKAFFTDTVKINKSVRMFVALYDNQIVSASLFLNGHQYAHYHFSGTLPMGLKVAANDLLLYKVSEKLCKEGVRFFHLGGGHSGNEDQLFKYKKRFNKSGRAPFYIGKKIHNEILYDELVQQKGVDINSDYFPLYRAPNN
ncbi:lipid II:glycine glycyltransferase FemX [Salibacterium aidingense]|uniref:lipid II:glycine glycyltransferase FemX n=1 Tax=Salibacterium aidingense TaxID=384933 RepID=UPI003BBD4066